MAIKELKDFISENYYKQIGFTERNRVYSMKCQKKKGLLSFATKLIEKIPDPSKPKSTILFEGKNTKLVKRSKIIAQQPKTIKNPNIVSIKLAITENPKSKNFSN